MTLPLMEPEVDGPLLEAWAKAVDEGPFSSLCFGERMAFDNPEVITLLGACAAWTKRVQLKTTVIVAQLHNPVMLAKSLATADMLSQGRLSVGLGVGGRTEDYLAVGADPATRKQADLAERVAIMKRVWAGEKVVDTLKPIGPPPYRKGGPELLAGAQGPKAIRAAAQWADGISGFSFDLNIDTASDSVEQVRAAWSEAGRPEPKLTTAFWFALGDDGRVQLQRHLRHYFNWIEADALEAMLPTVGFSGSLSELKSLLKQFEDIGLHEVQLIPTSEDIAQVHQIAELIS
ncbi:LLM class flavin-dependent oxidoreductase [Parahaliea sp. F7430]|uniref:LLM class flavin-dependent oxidoreductase n=2 Tax=Sediminihaliea albiluteola TaxID=2758564 RepID=A0A7W2TUJ6_9GAMM|nr:LLM class flavin-dependent oxidoreductase [Sediminihaliea albiluteola]